MGLMNINLDGELTVEEVIVPADGIVTLGHNLFKPGVTLSYSGDLLAEGQDYVLDGVDERLFYQKNVTLFTTIKILNEFLFNKRIEVMYLACGDYIKADIWNSYPTVESLEQSLKSKVDNSTFLSEVKRLDAMDASEAETRKSADEKLAEDIDTEASLRVAGDETLSDQINDEAAARQASDMQLDQKIKTEQEAREAQDTYLAEELSHEAELRLENDTRLNADIEAEAATRKDADDNLHAKLTAEAQTRAEQNEDLLAKIITEASERTIGDDKLQTQLADLRTKFEGFVPGLTYKVVTSLPTEGILADVMYLVPAGVQAEHQIYDEYLYIGGKWELLGSTATT
ncbi:MAG: hypothetical protein J1G30_04285 [Spirochaetales bacterium]|nr:hypothetical protein [Spirochaetales bacterium]